MTRYAVSVPIYGSATVWVDADSEADAVKKANDGEYTDCEINDWEVSIRACRGNICGRTEHDTLSVWADE